MKAESQEKGQPAPAIGLRRKLWGRVMPLLGQVLDQHLHFAQVGAVLRLIEKQLDHTRFPPEQLESLQSEQPIGVEERECWLEAKARELCRDVVEVKGAGDLNQTVVAAYVNDCERVAEYLHPKTSDVKRHDIRGFYWKAYQGWVANRLFEMFLARFPDLSLNDPRLERAQGWLEDRVFAEARFRKTLADYRPEKGRTFAGFLEFLLVKRCYDALDKFASEPRTDSFPDSLPSDFPWGDVAGGEEGSLPRDEPTGQSTFEPPPAESAAVRLHRCLSALRDLEERAVVELRYRAYVAPDLMADGTLERVAKAVSQKQLEKQFTSDQEALRKLQEEEIPERENDRREGHWQRERRQAELEIQGWSRERINELKHSYGCTIEQLESAIQQPTTTNKRRQELEFQIACIRYQKVLNRLLEAQDRLARYRGAQHPWVRSQEEIAELLGMDQVTVSRRLKSALIAMQDWLCLNSPQTAPS